MDGIGTRLDIAPTIYRALRYYAMWSKSLNHGQYCFLINRRCHGPYFPKVLIVGGCTCRTGKLCSRSIPENYTIANLSEDLDFYRLPCWKDLIRNLDAEFLRFLSDSALLKAIDEMLNQISFDTKKLVEERRFYIGYEPESDVLCGFSGSRPHGYWEVSLTEDTCERVKSLLKQRGFVSDVVRRDYKETYFTIKWWWLPSHDAGSVRGLTCWCLDVSLVGSSAAQSRL